MRNRTRTLEDAKNEVQQLAQEKYHELKTRLDTVAKQLTDTQKEHSTIETALKAHLEEFPGIENTRKKPGPKPGPKAHKVEAVTTPTPKVRKKPGPKPGSKRVKAEAAPATTKTRKKPGPKPKKEKAAKVAKVAKATTGAKRSPAAKSRAAEGRRAVASGDRPPIKVAIQQVMGDEILGGDEVLARLEKKGWVPNAKEPRKYVGYLLSASREFFEAVPGRRGFYHSKAAGKSSTSTAPKKSKKASSADEVLESFGVSTSPAS